jgi:Barstar (barnase inhibitor)
MSNGYIENLLPYGVVVAVPPDASSTAVPPSALVFDAEFMIAGTDRALIEMIAGAFHCPEPYGRNWDALYEVLRTMDLVSMEFCRPTFEKRRAALNFASAHVSLAAQGFEQFVALLEVEG